MVHFTDFSSNVLRKVRAVGYLHRSHQTLSFLWEEALSYSVLYYQNPALYPQFIQGLKKEKHNQPSPVPKTALH